MSVRYFSLSLARALSVLYVDENSSWKFSHIPYSQQQVPNSTTNMPYSTINEANSTPDICHGLTDGVRGEKIFHVEKFQISVHDRCGEI